jgi:hypothetical protein
LKNFITRIEYLYFNYFKKIINTFFIPAYASLLFAGSLKISFKMFSLKLVVFVLFCSKISPIKCLVKTWIPNLNFNNEQNWLGNKVPELGNDLVFSSNFFALTTLPKGDVGNLILPRDGGFILPENLEIRLRDSQHRESFFKLPTLEPWFLSKNWRNLNPENNQIDEFNPAIPHQEMIPCQMDTINFAAENNFRVDLQFISKIQFRGITLNGHQMYQHEFKVEQKNIFEIICIFDPFKLLGHRSRQQKKHFLKF